MCGLRIEVEGDQILSIRGDRDDPLSRGHICPKAPAIADLHRDPDRLRTPMRRTSSGWEPVDWEAALAETAERVHAAQEKDGRDAVALYVGNPAAHNHGMLIFGPMLLRTLRTKNRYSATSVDQLPHMVAAYLMMGHQLLFPIPDVDRTAHLLILGGNPLASNGSLMTAPGIERRLRAIQERGGRVVVVDPRRTETAALADEHVFIRPGTDALLLLGMLHVVLRERGTRAGHLRAWLRGQQALEEAAAGFAPERCADATGVPADTIRRLALELADAQSGVCYGRLGTSTQAFGTLCQWLINALNIVTGNFDRPGGAMFTQPALDIVKGSRRIGMGRGTRDRYRSRVRGLPEFGGELPVAALAEEILTGGQGRVTTLVTAAGNPVLSTPNGRQLERALGQLDFMVSIDPYLNETTCQAHLILPPASALERSHYDLGLHMVAVRNTAKWSPPLFDKPPEARHDWEILFELESRLLSLRGSLSPLGRLGRAALGRLGPDGLLDLGLRTGSRGALRRPGRGLSLRRLRAAPHGIDLGPLAPCLRGRLPREHAFIDLAPEPLLDEVHRLEEAFPAGSGQPAHDDGDLLLVGRRHLRTNNSWMHNVPKLVAGANRCTLLVHPADLAERGLTNGQVVTLRSRVGELSVPVESSEQMMRGVVSLPHGWGHDRPGIRMAVAQAHAGSSINDLTDHEAIDRLSGAAVLSGVPVALLPA